MILGAKMDMEYTFHLPKIIVSLNKLTWSEKTSSHRVILPQQTIILFSLISLCLKLWTVAWQIVLVMVSEWAEYQMSTRVRSLWLELRDISLTLCSFDEDTGVGHLPFLSPGSLRTFPSLLCSLQGWPFWAVSTAPYSSGFSLGLANGKLWWIFLFPDLPFRDLCSFSVDRLLQCWLPHQLRYSFFGLRMPMTYLDSHSLIP